MIFEYGANIAAMLISLSAIIMLMRISIKMGGEIGRMVKLLTVGIFLSVFAHAAFELLVVMSVIDEKALFPVMGSLLTVGSIMFVWAGRIAMKALD